MACDCGCSTDQNGAVAVDNARPFSSAAPAGPVETGGWGIVETRAAAAPVARAAAVALPEPEKKKLVGWLFLLLAFLIAIYDGK